MWSTAGDGYHVLASHTSPTPHEELFTTCNRFFDSSKVFEKSAGAGRRARGVGTRQLQECRAPRTQRYSLRRLRLPLPLLLLLLLCCCCCCCCAAAQTGAMAAAIDCKGKLITTLQRLFGAGEVIPSYASVNESAVVHRPEFQATLTLSHRGCIDIDSKFFVGERASTKKATEQSAAAQALEALESMVGRCRLTPGFRS